MPQALIDLAPSALSVPLERGLLSKMRIKTKPHMASIFLSALHESIAALAAFIPRGYR